MSGLIILCLMTATAWGLKTGDRAPGFSLIGADGKSHSLAQYRDQVVVLEWFNRECPFTQKFYDAKRMQAFQAEALRGERPAAWLTITTKAPGRQGYLTPKEAEETRTKLGMNNTTLLLDPRGKVARLYDAKTTPHVFIINRKGRLAYQGAVDDRPSAQPSSLEGAESYFIDALKTVRADRAPRTAATAPYGCPVKY